ncbi:MAG TPA: glycosyltransferase family 4 protein [Candidatus Peribacteria bacterium]|nr:glycosyltransferase family 4 protein [Candidatus Peribacteria bacterium]
MRILMTSDTYLPLLGGGEYHVRYVRDELQKLGLEVRLFTTYPAGPGSTDDAGIVRVRYAGFASVPSVFRALWRESKGAQLMHSHYSYRLAFLAGTVARLRGIPFVITQHGLGLLPQAGSRPWQTALFRLWRWWSMVCADSVISTSDDLSIDIRKLGFGRKITHIPNGFDASVFQPLPPPQGNPVVLTVRRLVPKTGIHYLIRALPELLKKHPGLRATLVGDGPIKPQLEALADELGVRGSVDFIGAVDHKRLLEYYRAAHVVAMPSSAESTSLTCIEAMALKRPVVASRVGGLVELLGADESRGYLVKLFDDEHCNYDAPWTLEPARITQLADAVSRVLTHPEEAAAKAGAASRHAHANFAWSLIASRTKAEVYDPLTKHA